MARAGLLCVLVAACCGSVKAADVKEKPTDKEIAAAYFEALMRGDVEKANGLVAAPFSFDRKLVLEKKEDVAAKHQEVLTRKGKREVPKYKTEAAAQAPALDPKVFPAHTAVRITIEGSGDFIDVYVTTGENPKIIGFSD